MSNPFFKFKTELYYEGSWNRPPIPNARKCTMEFFEGSDAGHAMIEFDIPSLEDTEHIGLEFAMVDGKRTLTGYDGVHCIPVQAVYILQQLGIVVPRGDGFDEELDAVLKMEGAEIPVRTDQ